MTALQEFYQRIDFLRNHGVKMKDIADWIDLAPSVLSSLYTTVLPGYFNHLKNLPPEEALKQALLLVNNVSKRKLLNSLEEMLAKLNTLEPDVQTSFNENVFARQLCEEMQHSTYIKVRT